MARLLTDAALAAIDRQRSMTHTLVLMDLPNLPLYLAIDAPHDLAFQRDSGPIIDTAPQTWTAVGGQMVTGVAEETGDPDGGGQDVEFAAIDPDFALGQALLAARPFGRVYQCWQVHYSDTGSTAGAVIGSYLRYHGYMNGAISVESVNPEELDAEPGTIRVSFRALNPLALIDVTRAYRTNPASHERWFPGDLFMDQVAKTAVRKIYVGIDAPVEN